MKQRGIISSLILSFAVALTSWAQTQVRIDELRTPASPAFALLGVEPSAIERPSTPGEVGMAILTQAGKEGGAIEFAPYWLRNHPTLTYTDFQNAGLLQQFIQTFSISLGSAETEREEGDTTLTDINLGVGLRAHWTFGDPPKALNDAVEDLRGELRRIAADRGADDESVTKTLAPKIKKVKQLMRDGRIIVEVAAGATENLPESSWSEARFAKWGAWVTPSYRMMSDETRSIDLVFVGRYLDDRLATENGQTTDVGGRLLWESGKIAASVEFLQRLGDEDSQRVAIVAQYRFTDDLYLTSTFGEDFADESGEGRAIALFGVNFTLGGPRVVVRPNEQDE